MRRLIPLLLALLLGLTACSAEEAEELLDVAIPIAVAVLEEMEANEAAGELVTVLGVTPELAGDMIANGFTTLQVIANYVQPEDLVDALGISEELAFAIVDKAKNA